MALDNHVNFVGLHQRAAQSAISKFARFRNNYYSVPNAIHVFVEGYEDPSFFTDKLRRVYDDAELFCIVCKGKPILASLRKTIYSQDFIKAKLLFVADRDHDDYCGEQIMLDCHTYITDFYSIESTIVCSQSIKLMAQTFLDLDPGTDAFKLFDRLVKEGLKNFYKAGRPVMAICIAARLTSQRPQFANLKAASIIEFDKVGASRSADFSDVFYVRTNIDKRRLPVSVLRKAYNLMRDQDPRSWMRGKYALWAFISACRNSARLVDSTVSPIPKALINNCEMSESICLERLGSRLKDESTFSSFVRQTRRLFVQSRRRRPRDFRSVI